MVQLDKTQCLPLGIPSRTVPVLAFSSPSGHESDMKSMTISLYKYTHNLCNGHTHVHNHICYVAMLLPIHNIVTHAEKEKRVEGDVFLGKHYGTVYGMIYKYL